MSWTAKCGRHTVEGLASWCHYVPALVIPANSVAHSTMPCLLVPLCTSTGHTSQLCRTQYNALPLGATMYQHWSYQPTLSHTVQCLASWCHYVPALVIPANSVAHSTMPCLLVSLCTNTGHTRQLCRTQYNALPLGAIMYQHWSYQPTLSHTVQCLASWCHYVPALVIPANSVAHRTLPCLLVPLCT